MPLNTAKLLLLNVLGGSAADTSASFTATTTGARRANPRRPSITND